MFKRILLLLLCNGTIANGLIVEHDTVNAIFSYLQIDDLGPQSMVVFDIDNTIAETYPTEFGGDQWFFACVNQYLSTGYDYYQAIKAVIPEYQLLQEQTQLALIEPEIVEIIDQLKKDGIRIIALTSRPASLLVRVIQQLYEIGIEFHDFESVVIEGYRHDYYRMQNGIIAVGLLGNKKGEILFEILTMLNYQPSTLIYIDDKEHQVKNVVQESINHGVIKTIGIRYSRLDEKVRQFNIRTSINN